jgi:hypothetical protein
MQRLHEHLPVKQTTSQQPKIIHHIPLSTPRQSTIPSPDFHPAGVECPAQQMRITPPDAVFLAAHWPPPVLPPSIFYARTMFPDDLCFRTLVPEPRQPYLCMPRALRIMRRDGSRADDGRLGWQILRGRWGWDGTFLGRRARHWECCWAILLFFLSLCRFWF